METETKDNKEDTIEKLSKLVLGKENEKFKEAFLEQLQKVDADELALFYLKLTKLFENTDRSVEPISE